MAAFPLASMHQDGGKCQCRNSDVGGFAAIRIQGVFHEEIAAVVDDVYEDLELWYPRIRLEEEGWQVVVAGT